MSTPAPANDTGKTPMNTKNRTRRLALVVAPAVVVAAGVWTATQGRANPGNAPAAHDHATQGAAAAGDPHAGHDMRGMSMGDMTMGDGSVHLDPEKARALGVTVVEAEIAPVRRAIRTTGHVTYDETRLSTVTPKFGGFVERLHVNFTCQQVRRGQPLLEIYSPELVAAQEELLAAVRMETQLREAASPAVVERTALLVDAARRRLLLWDVSPAQVQQIERNGQVRRTLTLHAPSAGFVTELMVQAGQAVEMGMPLYRLADLSTLWVEADVYEHDLRLVRLGEPAELQIAAYPGERFAGRISYVYPDVRPETRTARVRLQLDNPGGRIKPGMFATVTLDTPVAERSVMVPRDAVMHTGTHAMVFVEEHPGHYVMREVTIGGDFQGRTQILSGLLAGERVVARANFLIDAESRLMDGMMHMDH
jgi:membrane fusion protein, copper/silver efflux system